MCVEHDDDVNTCHNTIMWRSNDDKQITQPLYETTSQLYSLLKLILMYSYSSVLITNTGSKYLSDKRIFI